MRKQEAEGGCGVIGVACAEQMAAKHLLPALTQMCNRGNGKGGGIAAAGLKPEALGVTSDILENSYLLAIAYLDLSCQNALEKQFIHPLFEVDHRMLFPHLDSYQSLKDVTVRPPEVMIYFVRLKNQSGTSQEDELVYQNSYHLNCAFYSATGEKKAFVLSHGKNLLILKMVGYGDDVIRYYKLQDFYAHVWIGHHRYPTKGRVWHPGGAHPFIGLQEALVHNGDFANYFSICQYLAQNKIYPHFLTDTEVAVLLFDLYYRKFQYPLEYVMEAFAPTTERDFALLPEDKQKIYKLLQQTHIHASPDGPWFFLLAQSIISENGRASRLIGITDTSMLRPQVFALQKGEVPIGFAASEKQAIDAVLGSLSEKDSRFWTVADDYWNARGGSFIDGGAFSFTVYPESNQKNSLICTNKFETPMYTETLLPAYVSKDTGQKVEPLPNFSSIPLFDWVKAKNGEEIEKFLFSLLESSIENQTHMQAIQWMTKLLDAPFHLTGMRKSCAIALLNDYIEKILTSIQQSSLFSYVSSSEKILRDSQALVINAKNFPSEGKESVASLLIEMYKQGFKHFIIYNCQGQRFIGNGFGPHTHHVRLDVYGSTGDYLGSGIDGMQVFVHGSAQDQLAQIMKDGKLVIYGDIGQAFMYGAKGGSVFILGNTAGRPLINAVGCPRVIINGTALDYLAESFMAGNPFDGGGFVILNGLFFSQKGLLEELSSPYSGCNLFSLASGGAIYIRDPGKKIGAEQLNGGEFAPFSEKDWDLILPYLKENETYFHIPIDRLLHYQGEQLEAKDVYRKVRPARIRELESEEAWVKSRS